MKKIGLFLETEPHYGGAFQYSQAILHALAAFPTDGYRVVVVYTSRLWEEHLAPFGFRKVMVPKRLWDRVFDYAVRRLPVPVQAIRRLSPHLHPIAKALLGEECDLWIFPSQDYRSYEVPVPALVSVHDLMHRYERRFPEVSGQWEYERRERLYRNICAWARGVLVDSAVGRQQVVESYGLDDSRVHELPFVAPRHLSVSGGEGGFDARYRLPRKFIFYPAQFWEHKNHRGLVRAISILKGALPDLKLVLAGSRKNAYASVLQLVRDLGLTEDVIFLGYVPDADIAEIYRRARALVMPTFFGPTNIPPLEAFAAGCPVAASNVYGMPEQLGDAALLFDPASVEEIAACIRRLWTDDGVCADLVAKGKARVAQWGEPQFAQRLQSIVEGIVAVHDFKDQAIYKPEKVV